MRTFKFFTFLLFIHFAISTSAQTIYTVATLGGTHTTIAAAYAACTNATTEYIIEVRTTGAGGYLGLESFPINLGTNTALKITIRPETGSTLTLAASGTAVFSINGGDNITIDGRAGGVGSGNDFTIENTSTASGSFAIQFLSGANANTIKYCQIRGSNSSTTAGPTSGVISLVTGTNTNNTIDHCKIYDSGGNKPGIAIMSASATNNQTTVTNNEIINFGAKGICITAAQTGWIISGNSFYQTATQTGTIRMIEVSLGDNQTITNNYLGGSAANCGGSPYTLNSSATTAFYGIYFAGGNTGTSTISNNTISNLTISSTNTSAIPIFTGILTSGSCSYTISNNTIGSYTGTGSISITNNAPTGSTLFEGITIGNTNTNTISGNNIGAILLGGTRVSATTFLLKLTAGSNTIINNNLGGSTASNISSSSASSFFGIHINGSSSTVLNGNRIQNLQLTSSSSTNMFRGLYVNSGSFSSTNDTIRNILYSGSYTTNANDAMRIDAGTTAPASISGAYIYNLQGLNSTAVNVKIEGINIYVNGTIKSCFISSLLNYATGASPDISGIHYENGNSIFNNIILLENGTINTPMYIYGLDDNSSVATAQLYHNTVKITGTPSVGSTVISACYNRILAGSDNIKNNIFLNTRGGATTNNYCEYHAVTGSLSTNFNFLYANNANKIAFYSSSDRSFANYTTMVAATANVTGTISINTNGVPGLTTLLSNSGTNLTGNVPTDFIGTTRPTSPSLGAYQIYLTTPAITPATLCVGNTLSITFTTYGEYGTGNVFTAQLSDTNGSFTSPINLGSYTGTSGGTISATIPINTSSGTGYLIRIISSNPAFIGSTNGSQLTVPANGGVGNWTWNGTISTDWFNGCNWSTGTLPDNNSTVIIPGSTTFNPTIANYGASCKTITINSTNGGHLTVDKANNGTLTVDQ